MEADHVLANMRHLHSDVAQQTLDVIKKLDDVAHVVVDSARQVERGKTILHRQNEAFLMDRIKEITGAVNELKGMEGCMQLAASRQAEALLAPLANTMSDHVKRLAEKDTFAMRFMQKTEATQRKMADNLGFEIMLGLLLFFAGYAIGRLW